MLSHENHKKNPTETITLEKIALLEICTCPISTQLFFDPVRIGCGHTFESNELATWAKSSNHCPICRAQFDINEAKPDIKVKMLLELILKADPSLQKERYFRLSHLHYILQSNKSNLLDEVIKLLKASDYLNEISCEPGFEGMTALFILLYHSNGMKRLSTDTALIECINEQGLNARPEAARRRDESAYYYLAMNDLGRAMLVKHPKLLGMVTRDNFNVVHAVSGDSPLYYISTSDECRQLLLTHPRKLGNFIDATSLNAMDPDDGVSLFYNLTRTTSGILILQEYPKLLDMVTAESMNAISKVRAISAFYNLVSTHNGTEVLYKHPRLLALVTERSLNAIHATRKDTAFYYLADTDKDHKILLSHPELLRLVNAASLNAIDPESKRSAFQCLVSEPSGRLVLLQYPDILKLLTSESLNTPSQTDGLTGFYWLAATEQGQQLLEKNPSLLDLVTDETLNAIPKKTEDSLILESVKKGQSAYQCLMDCATWKQLIKANHPLQERIALYQKSASATEDAQTTTLKRKVSNENVGAMEAHNPHRLLSKCSKCTNDSPAESAASPHSCSLSS